MLPQELLTLILDIAHESANDDDPDSLPKSSIYIAASQVSKLWRLVALDNPLWWSRVLISPPWKLEAIATYLKRSKECPIDMHISVHPNYHLSRENDIALPPLKGFEALRDLISPHFHRCRSLRLQGIFNVDYELPIYLLQPLGAIDMPYLEEFTFDGEFPFVGKTPTDEKRIPLFSTAPLLRDLRMGGMALMTFSPRLSSVTTLHLSKAMDKGFTAFSELGRVLEASVSLTSLAVYDDLLNQWPGTEASCAVPLLEKLHILGNMLSVSELLIFLDAPKLKELVIAPVVATDLTLFLSYSSSQRNCFPLLISLTLAPAHPEAFEALPDASACFPKIELLILANVYLWEFVKVFTDENSIVFPDLLSIAITGVDERFALLLQSVVKFRQKHQVPFRNIFVDSPSLEILQDTEGDWYDAEFVEEDIWDRQRRTALYSNVKDLFVGRPYDET